MSGILAIAHLGGDGPGAPVDPLLLHKLTDSLRLRGPDGCRTWRNDLIGQGNVGLGHALLRTTFESAREDLPASLDGQVWITADVRLDARDELIARLSSAGRPVSDQATDADLVLHAYAAWDTDCLQHLMGDFAFVLWDESRQRLFCARDQFGVAPFFYARLPGGWLLGNTLDCLRQHRAVTSALNEQVIGDILLFGASQDSGATALADVQKLPPAHALIIEAGGLRCQRYWKLPEASGYLRLRRPEEYVEAFREAMRRAVADRLRTDRAAVMMSGGLDSTTVAIAAKEVLAASDAAYELRAYTWVYERVMKDEEGPLAGLAAQALDIPIEYMQADRQPPPESGLPAESLVSDGREPLHLMANCGIDTAFSGLGGDAAVHFDAQYWLKVIKTGQWRHIPADAREHFRQHGRRPPLFLRPNLRRWLGQPEWMSSFPEWLDAAFVQRQGLRERHLRLAREQGASDRSVRGMADVFWVNQMSRNEPNHTHVPVKFRYPFFDLRLLAFLQTVPSVPWFVNKHLLRVAMRATLPAQIHRRPKTPLPAWPHHVLARRLGTLPWMEQGVAAPELQPYVNPAAMLECLRSPERLNGYEYQRLVRAVELGKWLASRENPSHISQENTNVLIA